MGKQRSEIEEQLFSLFQFQLSNMRLEHLPCAVAVILKEEETKVALMGGEERCGRHFVAGCQGENPLKGL